MPTGGPPQGESGTSTTSPPPLVVCLLSGGHARVSVLADLLAAEPDSDSEVLLIDTDTVNNDDLRGAFAMRGHGIQVAVLASSDSLRQIRRALDASTTDVTFTEGGPAQLADTIQRSYGTEPVSGLGNPLTRREQQVLRAAAKGPTVAAIAGQFGLSRGTVRNYLSTAIHKTGARTRVEAARVAKDRGWL